jgi:hypothetical protein
MTGHAPAIFFFLAPLAFFCFLAPYTGERINDSSRVPGGLSLSTGE